jgi:DNA replication and repair protein RecF
LENRNALLENFNGKREMRETREMYELWTKQLWEITILIRKLRLEGLKNLQNEFNFLIENTLQGDFSIQLDYSGDISESFQEFYDNLLITKYSRECASGRSLFGVHLDDFNIIFKQKSSRIYASRGQQKLIVLFLKLAQLKLISKKYSKTVLLLDDFMTDFDDQIIASIIPALTSLANQLIFTAPSEKNLINSSLSLLEPQLLRL